MIRKTYSYHGVSEAESEEAQRTRFQVELEFVQCLGNPNYLHFLAQRNFLKEPATINYLKYLLYWKEPEYAKFLKYPVCLQYLDLLQHENFRKEIVNGQCAKFIDDQMILHWQHYTKKRIKILESGSQHPTPPPSLAPSLPPSTPAHSVSSLPTGNSTPGNRSPASTSSSAAPAPPALPSTPPNVANGHPNAAPKL